MCTVLYYCHRVSTQLQLTNTSYHIIHILVIFRLRLARVGAETSNEFVQVTTFTYCKCAVTDFIYVSLIFCTYFPIRATSPFHPIVPDLFSDEYRI